jgi:tetratricopeptide (TPR) repeat protein
VEGLLGRARGQRHQDPHLALHYARLATTVAGRSGPDELMLEALAEAANGFRILGEMDEAAMVWDSVDDLADRCALDPVTEGSILSLRASFELFARRFVDAETYLRKAIGLFREYGPEERLVTGLIQLGRILVDAERTNEACDVLREGAQLMVDGGDDWDHRTRVMLVHNWAFALVEKGDLDVAETALAQAQPIYEAAEPTMRLRGTWLAGRLRLRQRRLAEAEETLRSAMQRFAQAGLVFEWALAGLDLVECLARQKRFAEVRATAAELVVAFRNTGIGHEELVSLAVLREADHLQATLRAVRALAASLRRA